MDLEGGDYGTHSEGGVLSGPVDSLDSSFRLAAQYHYTNGYFRDLYLNRDDTNKVEEITLRGKWLYKPLDRLNVELTVLHIAINVNGG